MQVNVDEAENGLEALEKIEKNKYDLVLMDLQMPILDGFNTTIQIRRDLNLSIPILALTANALSGERDRCLEIGMNGYVSKPFQPERLYQEIGQKLKHEYAGWEVYILTADLPSVKHIGLKPTWKKKLFNGPLESVLLKYDMFEGKRKEHVMKS